jgi:hypothetical protein
VSGNRHPYRDQPALDHPFLLLWIETSLTSAEAAWKAAAAKIGCATSVENHLAIGHHGGLHPMRRRRQ